MLKIFFFSVAVSLCLMLQAQSRADSLCYEKLSRYHISHPECTAADIAALLIGTDYKAGTLERYPAQEQLIVNFSAVDCTTLVEQALAVWLTDYKDGYDGFLRMLSIIRYGKQGINGYSSRLHYFTAWANTHMADGMMYNIFDSLCPATLTPKCCFMSTHRDLYPAIRTDSTNYEGIRQLEKSIRDVSICWLEKQAFDNFSHLIHHGDIIAFVTNIKGLDVSHMGFAYEKNGQLRLLHAPSPGKQVEITERTLRQIVSDTKSYRGIIVLRTNKTK